MIVAGDATPPANSSTVSDTENQDDNGSQAWSSSWGTNLWWFHGVDPRGGEAFDENGPNLTECVGCPPSTTLVRRDGPEEVQSSGIEEKTGERSDTISSW